MRTVYIADDGREFSDMYDCKDYEFMLNHPCLNNVYFYDKDGERLNEVISDIVGYSLVRVVSLSMQMLMVLIRL